MLLGLGVALTAKLGPLGLLVRHGAGLDACELPQAVVGNNHAQDHQQDGEHELQSLGGNHSEAGIGGKRSHATDGAHHQRGERAAQKERHGHIEHPALAAGRLAEDGDGDHGHAAQQLVGGAKERPDVEVAAKGEGQANEQGHDGREPGVGDELVQAALGLLRGGVSQGVVAGREELLEAGARNARNSVQRGKCQRRDVHGHEDGGEGVVEAHHGHALGNAGGKDLEGGGGHAAVEGASASGVHVLEHDGGDDHGKRTDEGFDNHGAVADGQHVALVRDLLGGGARGHQAVEARKRAARDGDEEHREEVVALGGKRGHLVGGGDGGGGHGCLAVEAQDEDAQHGGNDHGDHHDGGDVVARLLQHLDGHGGGKDQVEHDDGDPAVGAEVDGELHAQEEHGEDHGNGKGELLPTLEVKLAGYPAKEDGDKGEEDGDGASRAGGVGLGVVNRAVSADGHAKGAGDHRGEGSDDDDGEEPGKDEEEPAAGLADVLLDELCKRLAVVLDGGVEGTKVVHGAKEDATDKNPQQDGQPAEHHGDDGARDGAGAADGRELVGEHSEPGCRSVVLVVLHAHSGREGLRVNAPRPRKPTAIN